jgi:vacuolar-type H+-ATPase subunit I/STV1
MFNFKVASVCLILCGAFTASVEAKLYKWVDDNGTTHYGETIPPEYANKDATHFNDKGRIDKRIDKLTPEEQRAKAAADAKAKADQLAATETKRRDNALLSTFSNEKEIDLSRDRNLQQVVARINSINTMLKSARESRAGHQKEQSDPAKQSKVIQKGLQEDIAQDEARIVKLEAELAQNEQELASVKARFEADKQRFRELKGASATGK